MKTRRCSQFDLGYVFGRREIETALTSNYLRFLKEAGITDLDKIPNLFVAKYVLKRDKRVEDAVKGQGVQCRYAEDGTVGYISQPNARRLIHSLGGIVLPVGVMYKLVIPQLKQAAEGNESARETLEEMTSIYIEWLEDLVLDKTRLKIGTQERIIVLPDEDGIFDRQDINEFGYPTRVRPSGEFYHWHVRGDERAAIRSGGSVLDLDLSREPSMGATGLGYVTQIFSE